MVRKIAALAFASLMLAACSESSTPADASSDCPDDECLCSETSGSWDEGSCGHYVCGNPPDCEALIPGCDCGAGRSFASGIGCAADATCECTDARCRCEATDGTWDETSCGHYSCGMPPLCDAIIPGCDCGAGATFVPGAGCTEDPGC